MKELNGLEHLNKLFLSQTAITDAGLQEIAELQSLKTLCLGGNRSHITGVGLCQLTRLTSLKTLSLVDLRPDYRVVLHLRQAIPNLEIPNVDNFELRTEPLR